MNVFYNEKGLGDVLLVSLKEIEIDKREVERKGDVARLFHMNSGETVGYHLFNMQTYEQVRGEGMLAVDQALVDLINEVLSKNNWDASVDLPQKPSFVVGHVDEIAPHPDADKLRVCQVDVGGEQLQIVCGAKNVDEGQKVVVAVVGADMPSGMSIRASKLRGEKSHGMICSINELAIPAEQEEPGIFVLPERYEVGKGFLEQYHQ